MPFPPATRAIPDKSQVVLVKHPPDEYRVEVWQSFADDVWGMFPSRVAAEAWYNSPEYQKLIPLAPKRHRQFHNCRRNLA
jgi:Domain of unknown function (DUF1330)